MTNEILASLEYIEKEKGISKEVILSALKSALLSACRKTFQDYENYDIDIDPATGKIKILKEGKEVFHPDFGRIAAQTAKQVIIQKIREAERESIFEEFSHKEGDIISGAVHTVDKKAITVDLGKTEAILPLREQYSKDRYRQGDSIRAYVTEVKMTNRGPEIILSRSHPNLVKKLFELEVPEIHDGIVEVKAIAREAGSRTKIAVLSRDDKVDCVGSCVGMRGQRVKNIVRELGGEKIDIVRYSDDTEAYIRNSLSPAEIAEIKLNSAEKQANVMVADDQLSLAIGKKGQNVRLASKLTGWKLDVRSQSQRIPLSDLEGVGEKTEEMLRAAGIQSIKDILKSSPEELAKIDGIGPKTAEKIFAAAHKAILGPKGGILPVIPAVQPEESPAEPESPAPESEEKGK
ncbi:MAG: transcription termination factor NusA [Candidatus Omnitrophica bacterium]|nr:transcription termination factor NusA [Candidatus Omnitrophota bacterium]